MGHRGFYRVLRSPKGPFRVVEDSELVRGPSMSLGSKKVQESLRELTRVPLCP